MVILLNYFKNKKCIFLRVEPSLLLTPYSLLLRRAIDINPRATMILDLRKTPDELLANMHQKTRYNINLSQKKNLLVSDKKDADLFIKMTRQTAKRDKFRPHQDRHYHEIIFSSSSYQLTVLAGTQPIATAVFIGFGDTFTYLFGASDYDSRALMAPYLIQWEGIKLAQRFGYEFYDFFGVAPLVGLPQPDFGDHASYQYDPKHQYAGVTRFKQGFGGEYREQPGTFDLVISPRQYNLYKLLRSLRRMV